MGTFSWPMTVSTVTGEGSRVIEAMVDTGSTYTMLPASTLRDIGIAPTRNIRFTLANGSIESREAGEMRVIVDGNRAVATVIFGAEDTLSLMGATTLEEVGLAVDPVKRRLVPTTALLL